jgi:uncharacterized membrane protein
MAVGRSGRGSGLLWALVLVAFLGFIVSLYLTFMHYQGVVPQCHVVKGCDVVQTSQYSEVLGIPVALPGALFFAVMFYLAIGLTSARRAWLVHSYKILAYLGALAAIPLFLIQAVILKAFCTYCLVIEVLLIVTWLGSFGVHRARVGADSGQAGHDDDRRPKGRDRRPKGRRSKSKAAPQAGRS